MATTKKYRKRFVRSREPMPFRLTDDDVAVLQLLAEYRFLNLLEIRALRPRGIVALRDRLRRMFHAGLIDRPRAQRSYFAPTGPLVYALGSKGADVLAERGLLERGSLDWSKKNAEVGRLHLEHSMMISRFRVTLTVALLEHAIDAHIVRWTPESVELNYSFQAAGQSMHIRPDSFLTLEQSRGRLHFCLEADRSTMTVRRYMDKLRAYWAGRQAYQQKLGINVPFRVLTLTVSEARRDNLVKAARDLGEAGQSGRFLFACERDYCLEEPSSILGPIWHSPQGGSLRSLLAE